VGHETGQHRFVFCSRQDHIMFGETAREKLGKTAADHAAYDLFRVRRQVKFGKSPIERRGEIADRVGKRPVEIEHHSAAVFEWLHQAAAWARMAASRIAAMFSA
jgi:hypothetical protein